MEERAGSKTIVSALGASRGNDTPQAMDYNVRLLYEGERV